jgi:hypothetical protein
MYFKKLSPRLAGPMLLEFITLSSTGRNIPYLDYSHKDSHQERQYHIISPTFHSTIQHPSHLHDTGSIPKLLRLPKVVNRKMDVEVVLLEDF